MDAFSYLSVLLSIILGLAITQVLKGFRGLMQGRRRTRGHAPAIAWSILVLVIAVQSWWSMFDLRHHQDWTFLEFAVVLAQTIIEYLLAALVLPDFHGEAEVDLRAHYDDNRRWFFGLLVALIAASLAKAIVVYGELPRPLDLAFHGVFAALGLCGIALRGARVHAALVVAATLVIGLYIAMLFTHLA